MNFAINDIIAAISTPTGMGGIAVIRLSGCGSHELAKRFFKPLAQNCGFEANRMYAGWIIDAENGEPLDEALYVRFAAPRSFTRQDVVELQIHGGGRHARFILDRLLENGARLAEAGEFTMRAVLNGRIDLTRAEAAADLIAARSDGALKAARRQLSGELFRMCENARRQIVSTLAMMEAYIDFPEDELPQHDRIAECAALDEIRLLLEKAADTYRRGRLLAEGALVVICGAPNVGKSSLMNRLARRERSIVDSAPGTTRDVVEEPYQAGGVAVRLADTAGLREAEGVEARGVEMAWKQLDSADLVVWVVDASRVPGREESLISERLKDREGILLLNKCDLPAPAEAPKPEKLWPQAAALHISARNGDGIEHFEKLLEEKLCGEGSPAGVPLITSARHHTALSGAAKALIRAVDAINNGQEAEFVACELREALSALADITGATANDELLEDIFSRFCIGK